MRDPKKGCNQEELIETNKTCSSPGRVWGEPPRVVGFTSWKIFVLTRKPADRTAFYPVSVDVREREEEVFEEFKLLVDEARRQPADSHVAGETPYKSNQVQTFKEEPPRDFARNRTTADAAVVEEMLLS